MSSAVSGVILYDETIRQKAKDGTPLVDLIKSAGAVPGIKVDSGAKDLALSPGEKITEGLDGLRDRLKEYYGLGARFAKWRAVIDIGAGHADLELHQRQRPRARPLCRALPGGRHRADRRAGGADGRPDCRPRHRRLLRGHRMDAEDRVPGAVRARVMLEGMVLKPNMVVAGKKCPKQASAAEVAEKTVRVLKAMRPGGGRRHRLPVRRPERRRRRPSISA